MVGEINYINGRPYAYTEYTLMPFSSWEALESFAKISLRLKPNQEVVRANNAFKEFIQEKLRELSGSSNAEFSSYGINGKHPRSYEDAIKRKKFIYWEEYKEIKKQVEKKIQEELQKSKIIEVMKPRFVYNDRQIGQFIYERAAMSLIPDIFLYVPSKKREVSSDEKVIQRDEKMYLLSDDSLVVNAIKVEFGNGTSEYFELEAEGEETLKKAQKKAEESNGTLLCSSTNKKVYLYKEKKPKMFNAVKIIVGMTAGGFTSWKNDFYTGIAAAACTDVLESLGYSVHVEVAVGGGRCSGCYRKLNFNGTFMHGRRFFTFPVKKFDELLDLDSLLYTLSDPSFHNIKFISLLNNFFNFYGDQLDTRGNPSSTWHGIEEEDMINPIGMYHKYQDFKNNQSNVLHFYIHRVKNQREVIEQITQLALECENKNLKALLKYSTHDFGINK